MSGRRGPDRGPDSPRMWGGVFEQGPSEAMKALNDSLPVDLRLWRQDIRGSRAWVGALRAAGILDPDEESVLLDGLDRVAGRLEAGAGVGADDEDVHGLVERLLYDEVGPLAGKLHTGRSRNDQVVTDLRLWCLGALEDTGSAVRGLGRALLAQARAGLDLLLPGYTHGQQAQPVRWGYVLLAHAWPLVRDLRRLEGARQACAVLPLGSGALAGSGVRVDRVALAEALGFSEVTENALDATGDRDFVAEVLFAVTMIALHLSRLGGELIIYNASEFGFLRLADAYATGSSLMPQKRNPDVLELARGKGGRVLADLVAVLTVLRGLPAGYSKDLQEDKTHLFDAVDTVLVTTTALAGAVETLTPVPERMLAVLEDALLATDVADLLVGRGVPFREAHGIVGRLVRRAEAEGVGITELVPDVWADVHPMLPDVMGGLGTFEASVERRSVTGGTARRAVLDQIEALEGIFGV